MDAASFERVYDSLQEFHFLRPPSAASTGITAGITFRRCWCQDQHPGATPRTPLARNRWASPARAMQRFLTEARWSDETVIGRLQEYLPPWLGHPEAVWVFDGSDFSPSRAGNRREWPGSMRQAGQGGQLPGWDAGLRQPAGPGVGGQAAVSCPRVGPPTRTGAAAGVPEDRRNYRVKDGVGPGDAGARSWSWATSGRSGLPARRRASGCRRTFREGLAALGMATCWSFRAALRSGPWTRLGPVRNIRVFGPPPQTQVCGLVAAADHGAAR